MWSGGENVTYLNWDKGQPDNRDGVENAAQIWGNGKWNDCDEYSTMPFYCISVPNVEGKMSWEEALEHCRGTDRDLPSLLSEIQHLDAQEVIQLEDITDLVWIGLRFLNDRWLWMNGDSLVYEAWAQGDQDHLCPTQKRCGALSKTGLWKNWDCQDVLNFLCI
ncbi:snaclec 5-like [Channa argus]|nr:hypothetical protein Q8A73_003490 [Channa argus]